MGNHQEILAGVLVRLLTAKNPQCNRQQKGPIDMQDTTRQPQLIIPAFGGFYRATADLAYPLIRIVTGVMLIPHGWSKFFGGGLE
ncbi:MAG: hypothetical protein ACE5H7_05205 [Acidiferrobacterales bacterium]